MRYALWLCLLVACSSPPKRELEPTPAAQPSTESVMRHLLAEIERPGRQHEINADTFFARGDALSTLVRAYEASDGAWARWKLLRLARKTRSPEARALLMREAMKPVPKPAADSVGMADTFTNVEYVNRLEAALGVLDYMPSSESDVEELITTVAASISRVLASELFTQGQLTARLVDALQARSLPTEFRDLSESEERALMSDKPSSWKVQP